MGLDPRLDAGDIRLKYAYSRQQSGDITVGHNVLVPELRKFLDGARVRLIVDERAWPLHADRVACGLVSVQDAQTMVISAGENAKTLDTWASIMRWLASTGTRRRDVLLAVGGGSVSDVVGFAASTYLRGVPYLNVPTTLLGQVDGAVGGKVAINSDVAKNAIGSFHHPFGVVADVGLLQTLSRREISTGIAEAVKVSLTEPGGHLFRYLERHVDELFEMRAEQATHVVAQSIKLKLALLAPDPFEEDLRRLLNFGHTIGHALETAENYAGVRHGEAVAVGMATASRVGLELGLTVEPIARRIERLLRSYQLPTAVPPALVSAVLRAIESVRRSRDGKLYYVVPVDFGRLEILDEVADELLAKAMVQG